MRDFYVNTLCQLCNNEPRTKVVTQWVPERGASSIWILGDKCTAPGTWGAKCEVLPHKSLTETYLRDITQPPRPGTTHLYPYEKAFMFKHLWNDKIYMKVPTLYTDAWCYIKVLDVAAKEVVQISIDGPILPVDWDLQPVVVHKAMNKKDERGKTIPREWTAYCGDPGGIACWRWIEVACIKCFQRKAKEKDSHWERELWARDQIPTNP
jgi:hypothetical protein